MYKFQTTNRKNRLRKKIHPPKKGEKNYEKKQIRTNRKYRIA